MLRSHAGQAVANSNLTANMQLEVSQVYNLAWVIKEWLREGN